MTPALASQPHPNGHRHTIRQGSTKQERKPIQPGICWTEALLSFVRKFSPSLKHTKGFEQEPPLLNRIKNIIVGEDGA